MSVGLNVFSVTALVITLRSLVRTKAAPLPGFTCWNSMMHAAVHLKGYAVSEIACGYHI